MTFNVHTCLCDQCREAAAKGGVPAINFQVPGRLLPSEPLTEEGQAIHRAIVVAYEGLDAISRIEVKNTATKIALEAKRRAVAELQALVPNIETVDDVVSTFGVYIREYEDKIDDLREAEKHYREVLEELRVLDRDHLNERGRNWLTKSFYERYNDAMYKRWKRGDFK